jgi:hypothetical protein
MITNRFVGGPYDGRTFDVAQLAAVADIELFETAKGLLAFRIMPSPADCERILRAELARGQGQEGRYPYRHAGLSGFVVEYRAAADEEYHQARRASEVWAAKQAAEVEAVKAWNAAQEGGNIRRVVGVALAVAVYLLASCWAPMFWVATPSWCLWVEPLLVAVLSTTIIVTVHRLGDPRGARNVVLLAMAIGYLSLIALSVIAMRGPGWTDARGLIPTLALLPCWIAAVVAGFMGLFVALYPY